MPFKWVLLTVNERRNKRGRDKAGGEENRETKEEKEEDGGDGEMGRGAGRR